MGGPDPATGVLFICGVVMFLSGCMIVRVLRALDEDDKSRERYEEYEEYVRRVRRVRRVEIISRGVY